VGHVLADVGVKPFEFFEPANSAPCYHLGNKQLPGNRTIEPVLAFTGGNRVQLRFDDPAHWTNTAAYQMLALAQSYSDRGAPWGKAVKWAIAGEDEHEPVILNGGGYAPDWSNA